VRAWLPGVLAFAKNQAAKSEVRKQTILSPTNISFHHSDKG
jgi:hypothetical protein